ncbi:MAG TPA: hypothetical protein RMH85_30430 [Polyangiaceae bacterium LLY-WYZ-15_(1-7)]|nr:hypothetical protein [Polyangiaceae bacterium LLY-WYZ-15_(1-7)]
MTSLFLLLACGDNGAGGAARCDDRTPCPGGQRCEAGRCVDALADAGPRATPDASDRGDASAPDGGESLAAFCEGEGPLIVVGDGAGSAEEDCAGRIAERSFRYALCTCEGLVTSHTLRTDSFDSDMGPYTPGGRGGSVGTNGGGNSTARWDVGGALWSSGDTGWTVAQPLEVGSELHLASRLAGSEVEVARDARVGGGIALDALTVGGELRVPEGAAVAVDALALGSEARGPVSVEDPCACGEGELVDIAGFVARYARENENAAIGLAPDALADVAGETTLELPCGRYYLDRISAGAPLTLRVTGRVALFVAGSITANDAFRIVPEGDAEVDLFVGGDVTGAGAFAIGTAEAPARARMYVGGDGTVNLSAATTFAGNLYAPRAELVTAGAVEIFGAAFVRRLAASGALDIHYDTAILEAGDDCGIPETCDSCGDCPSVQACIDGACTSCRESSDCCAPLVCVEGACVPELI